MKHRCFWIIAIILTLTIFLSCNPLHRETQPENKSNKPPGENLSTTKSFELILNGEEDIVDFCHTYFDYDPDSMSILVLPESQTFPDSYSTVMVVDKYRNVKLLGNRGQAPTEINGIRSTGKFLGQNLVGIITMFGESSFLVLNQQGDVIKRWKFPERFGRIMEFKFNNNGIVFYGETIVLPEEMNHKVVIGEVDLGNSTRKTLLNAKDVKKIFLKYKIPLSKISINGSEEKEMLNLEVYFLPDSYQAIITSHFVSLKKPHEIVGGIIFNLRDKSHIPYKIKPFFSKNHSKKLFVLIGNSFFENKFFVREYPIKKAFLHKKLFLFGGVIHKINATGKEEGVYSFYDDFYKYLEENNIIRFYLNQIRGLKNNEVLCLGETFSKVNEEKMRKALLFKAKLKKIR